MSRPELVRDDAHTAAVRALRHGCALATARARRDSFDLYAFRWRLTVDEYVTAAHRAGHLAEDAYKIAIAIFEAHRDGRSLALFLSPPITTKGTR